MKSDDWKVKNDIPSGGNILMAISGRFKLNEATKLDIWTNKKSKYLKNIKMLKWKIIEKITMIL